ncbi:type IX secretion system outer membrane channel protein PorV [Flavobacterium sp. GT3R68]|uniref:type IX secretion system outer membrane channel protein PorV n=1 Tax=Flavobacterium sp. GT3R68 TaxID=2594437 RepID=UPI000F879DD3|nr:type IX secretion system outer membrane channel protein PorV [Flavobacterium sp. GT3R68]RTY86598.1 type IX secretion system outer membrane channel protein PorV [Flavobacterium sp. GSN2]TRW92635.1 type IX secretion system outer membrane channel protein PorV [Flavobacterium sp. GT3R68]
MKRLSLLVICFFVTQLSRAQEDRVITTGVPFLLVAADARAAGMGDQGVATAADAFSQQWNPAKYAFSLDKQGFTVSYTPYLTALVNDISLGQVTYFNKINERSAFAGSIRYFSLGEIELRQNFDDIPQVVKPSEFALDGSYSLKLSDHLSMAVAGRFLSSNLKIQDGTNDTRAAKSFAFDVAAFYQSEEVAYSDFNGKWRLGFNLQNLGPKISYDSSESSEVNANFLPAQMKFGAGFDFVFDEYNKVTASVEINKLLVPTPQDPDLNGDGTITNDERAENNANYRKIGWVSGIFKSFGDAPDGFGEELKEFTYSAGAEYLYQDSFAMRLGYFHESPEKGARQFFSLGAGFKYNVVKVDVSYLFSASKVQNPLENTLRFSLTFNFGDKYEEY